MQDIKKKKWKNLLDNKCIYDDVFLVHKKNGLECPLATETRSSLRCSFFISHEKLEEMKRKIQKDYYKRPLKSR